MTSAVATQFLPGVASASATKDYLVVSLHDVAPSTQPVADKILSELTQKGIRHCSLLVVPDYHHQARRCKIDNLFPGCAISKQSSRDRDPRIFSRAPTARE